MGTLLVMHCAAPITSLTMRPCTQAAVGTLLVMHRAYRSRPWRWGRTRRPPLVTHGAAPSTSLAMGPNTKATIGASWIPTALRRAHPWQWDRACRRALACQLASPWGLRSRRLQEQQQPRAGLACQQASPSKDQLKKLSIMNGCTMVGVLHLPEARAYQAQCCKMAYLEEAQHPNNETQY